MNAPPLSWAYVLSVVAALVTICLSVAVLLIWWGRSARRGAWYWIVVGPIAAVGAWILVGTAARVWGWPTALWFFALAPLLRIGYGILTWRRPPPSLVL